MTRGTPILAYPHFDVSDDHSTNAGLVFRQLECRIFFHPNAMKHGFFLWRCPTFEQQDLKQTKIDVESWLCFPLGHDPEIVDFLSRCYGLLGVYGMYRLNDWQSENSSHLYIYIYGGFHSDGGTHNSGMVYFMENLINMDDWGSLHFRKPPYMY